MNEGRRKLSAQSLALRTKFVFLALVSLFLSVSFVYAQGSGIGTYDLRSPSDKVFAFDYNGTGVADHLVLYRPGTGIVYILQNNTGGGGFTPVYASSDGIGTYDLKSQYDQIMPFDYSGSGLQDHLLCYRPGSGVVYILANVGGMFMPVYTSFSGIGGYDLMATSDVLMPFDYNGSGSADHLVAYRPGTGEISIFTNNGGNFTPIFQSDAGIGSYDLKSPNDQMFAYDFYGTGVADHLVFYRPGEGIVQIIEPTGTPGIFNTVFQSTTGIGTYDLKAPNDRMFAYDYTGMGTLNNIVAYRPGSGIIFILSSSYFNYSPVYASASGVGSYDLQSTLDEGFSFNYTSTGLLPNLVFYRPGSGIIFILNGPDAQFSPVYP